MNIHSKALSTSLFLGILLVFIQPVYAAENRQVGDMIRPMQDYWQLPPRQIDAVSDLSQLQKVADIEIFYWYGCEACMKVERKLDAYLAEHPEITIKRTPLVATARWRAQAYVQPLIEQLEGKVQTPSRYDIYQQCLEDCSFFESYESTRSWLKAKYQINKLPFVDEPKIWQSEKKFRERADSFSISQVPTIIIKEQFVTDANTAKTTERLVEIVDYLLNQ